MNRLSFKQLFDTLPSPHMILDRNLDFVAANPAYEAAVMRREADLLGKHIFEAFPGEDGAEELLRSSMLRALETGEPDTLAYIHYRIPRPDERGGGWDDRYWTAVHAPLFDEAGKAIFVLQNTVDITELVGLRESAVVPFRILPGERELVQRAREAEEAYGTTRDDGSNFARLFDQAPSMVAVLQGPRHVFTFANQAYRTFFGGRDLVGQGIREALPEVQGQGFGALLDEVFGQGVVRTGGARRILLRRGSAADLEEAFVDFSFHPIRNRKGDITGVFVQAGDRTDNVRFQQRQRLLLDELNHRVKNTLSSVQSIARQSFKSGADETQAQATFEARIQALSKAHDALSERHWEAVDLRTIVRQELAVFDPSRVSADGPLVRLSPKAAIAFAMVFHELASNAGKYGSLAQDDGSIVVSWIRPADRTGRIGIEWKEIGPVQPEATIERGFGIRMLERIVEGELEGGLNLAFGDSGLICRMEVGVSEVEDFAGVS